MKCEFSTGFENFHSPTKRSLEEVKDVFYYSSQMQTESVTSYHNSKLLEMDLQFGRHEINDGRHCVDERELHSSLQRQVNLIRTMTMRCANFDSSLAVKQKSGVSSKARI